MFHWQLYSFIFCLIVLQKYIFFAIRQNLFFISIILGLSFGCRDDVHIVSTGTNAIFIFSDDTHIVVNRTHNGLYNNYYHSLFSESHFATLLLM